MDHLNISFRFDVGIQSLERQSYFFLNPGTNKIDCTGIHPFFKSKNADNLFVPETFIILNFDNRAYDGPITFGSTVAIISK